MATKIDSRQVVLRAQSPFIGNAANEQLDAVFPRIDAEMAKLYEDRNVILQNGGIITFTGTQIQFTEDLEIVLNQKISGAAPQVITLGSANVDLADGEMWYAVIDRTAGTATTSVASTLPAVVAANQEVFLLVKRVDAGDGTAIVYFRNGFALVGGQSSRLGVDPILTNKQISYSSSDDSVSSGNNAVLSTFNSGIIRLTNGSLASIGGIPAGKPGQFLVLENKTGVQIMVNNEDGTVSSVNRIQTGSGGNIPMSSNASFVFVYDSTSQRWQMASGSGSGGSTPSLMDDLIKSDKTSVVFNKTSATTIDIKANTSIYVKGQLINFPINTAVIMPALTAGTDYAIFACQDGTVRADASFSFPAGYTAANSALIGGFHYGLVSPTETVAGGSFATSGNGMIWTQTDVNMIRGINAFSLWDLKFRPKCDPRGMALIAGSFWMDIYLCNTDHMVNGTSKAGSNIASGTIFAKRPTEFGGNGTSTYSDGTWYSFNEVVRSHKKRFPKHSEFIAAAFGVTENQSLGGASVTPPTTLRQPGYTSKYGLEQVTGHIWVWGEDSSYRQDGASPGFNWRNVNGGRGQVYIYNNLGLVYVILGGARDNAAFSGSRASDWALYPWAFDWGLGVRAVGDHLILV